jgi:hypothetical protein
MDKSSIRILNRDQIKLIAIVLMTLNHIAHFLMSPGSLLYEILEDAGHFTAITMCFFLVEGYGYTHSKREYAKRLLIFAFISEIPYLWAVGYFQLNVVFTLFFCFLIMEVMDSPLSRWKRNLFICGLILLTVFCDCAFILAIAVILFKKSENNPGKQAAAYGGMTLLFWALSVPGYAPADAPYPFLSGTALLHGFYSAAGFIASGVAVLLLYNGKKAQRHRAFHKWCFYIYYPAHLLILCLIRLALR